MVIQQPLDPKRPLIICDADEVLVQFLKGLERHLDKQGLYLDLTSFRIHGNVREQASHRQVPDATVTDLIARFFEHETATLDPVPGAGDALRRLGGTAQIVILSNLPASALQARIDNLAQHGMSYPVIAGSGPKGSIVKQIIGEMTAPIVFVDDLPPHHTSVASITPRVHRLHFVADPRLAGLIGPSPDAHARIDTWPEATTWIEQALSNPS